MTLELMAEYKWCWFIMNRIIIQFSNIMQNFFYNFNDKQKEELNEKLDELSLELKYLYDYFETYKKSLNTSFPIIQEQIKKTKDTKNGIEFKNPSLELKKLFEEFIIKSVIVIRKLINILGKIYGINVKQIEWKQFEIFFQKTYWEVSQEYTFAKDSARLLLEIYWVRKMVEHESLVFHRIQLSNNKIEPPSFSLHDKDIKIDKMELWKYMKRCFEGLFHISEDMIAIALNHKAPDNVWIYTLSEEDKKEWRFKDFEYRCYIKNFT